jgi:hypothetical protein
MQMKRLLFISLLPLSAFAGAQTITSHDAYVSHSATQSVNGGGGNDGPPYSHYVSAALNGDTGLVSSNYSHVGSASSVTFDATGQSKNSLDVFTQTYSVDLSSSIAVNSSLTHDGFINLDALSVDRLDVHLDNPTLFSLSWNASTDSSLDLYDASFNSVVHANLAGPGSASITLAAGDYTLLGAIEQSYIVTGLFGFTGSTDVRSTSLSYQASLGAVPEPSAFAALGLGAVALLKRRKK